MSDSTQKKLTADVAAFLETRESDTGSGTDTLVVLIEIDLPRPVFKPSTPSGANSPLPGRGSFSNIPDADEISTKVEEANVALEKSLGRTLHWLAAPHVFVGELTRDELETVASLEFVKQIHKNRELGKGNSPSEPESDSDSAQPEVP